MHFPAVTMTAQTILRHLVRKANTTTIAYNSCQYES